MYIQTHIQTDRQTDIHAYMQTDRQTDSQTAIHAYMHQCPKKACVQAFRHSGMRTHTHAECSCFLEGGVHRTAPFCNNFRMARNCRQDRRSGTLKTFLDSCELPSFMVMISTFFTVDVLKLAYFINLKLLCEHRACSRCKAVEKMRLFDVQQVGDRLRRLKDIHHPMISGVLDARLNFSAAIFPVPSFHGFDLHSIQRAKGHKTTYDSVSPSSVLLWDVHLDCWPCRKFTSRMFG